MENSDDSPIRSKVLVIVVAVAVSQVGVLYDRVLFREGIPRYDLLAISNTLTGVVAGGFFWQAMRRDRERRQFVSERLRTISEMNHHIRNALQVISFYSPREEEDGATVKLVHDAVKSYRMGSEGSTPRRAPK